MSESSLLHVHELAITYFFSLSLSLSLSLSPVLGKQVNLCQVCLPVLKNEWSHIQPKGDCIGDEVLPIYSTVAHYTDRDLPILSCHTFVFCYADQH
jgi:hypothetical protein